MPLPNPNFDRVARIYRWAEYLTLGPLLERIREHFIPQLIHCRQAFVLGDGDGRFLARLLNGNPSLQALAVDTSATMLHLLQQRCAFADLRLQTKQASALTLDAPTHTDLIVTHFFLDCLSQSEVDALALRLASQIQPHTLWLLSDFAIPPTPILRSLSRLYVRALYLAFRILAGLRTRQLPDPQSALTRAGFVRIQRHQWIGGLLYTDLWQHQPTRTNC